MKIASPLLRLVPVLLVLVGCVPRPEVDVVAYVSVDEEFAGPILAAFDRRADGETGVVPRFDAESTKTVGLVNRILAERDRPTCDVFWNNEPLHAVRLRRAGMLATRDWDLPPDYPPDMVAADGSWCGFAARARVLIVNTKRLPDPADWPRRVEELADPKWGDRCAMARPVFGTTATHFAVLAARRGVDDAETFLDAVIGNARVYSGNKQVALAVSGGAVDWGLTDTDDAIIERDGGYPVEIVFPDQSPADAGTLRIPNTVMVLKDCPHPVAADLLADYLVTPETEDRLAMGNSSQIPIHRGSEFPPRVLPAEPVRWMRADFPAAAEVWDDWIGRVAAKFD